MINVYIESGRKHTFACAVDWPGWCRSGGGESAALQALFDVGPRYARLLQTAGIDFQPPDSVSAFTVIERLKGSLTTDFGALDKLAASDANPMDEAELLRFQTLLWAYWQAFDAASQAAAGKERLFEPRKASRGERSLEKIVQHLLESDAGYLWNLGWKFKIPSGAGVDEKIALTRQAALQALAAAVHGELPSQSSPGSILGKLFHFAQWTPRGFMRRLAWHTVDHVWEIEDRIRSIPGLRPASKH